MTRIKSNSEKALQLRILSFYWGVMGVVGILMFAIIRLAPKVFEMSHHSLSSLEWAALIAFVPYMAYAEGYKGFYLNFSPRIIARANYLRTNQVFLPAILAPLFCMGYFHATLKRKIISYLVTLAIMGVVLLVSYAPQPLRGIIDAGVVVGLGIGVVSIIIYWIQAEFGKWTHPISADLPE